jgi:3-isopropylmalate dehydratase small subunit
MDNVKKIAIRSSIIKMDMDVFNTWREENEIETDKIMELGKIILEKGCDAEGYVEYLKEYFINYADEHTTILLPDIRKSVMNSNYDFIKEDWYVIFKNLFPVAQIYGTVVYSVNSFTDTDQIADNNFSLFFNYDKAVETFNTWKSELMDRIMEEDDAEDYEIVVNRENFIRIYNETTDAFYQIDIEKKPVM